MILIFGQVNKFSHLQVISEEFIDDFKGLSKKDYMMIYVGSDLMKDERTVRWLEERPYSSVLLDADGDVLSLLAGKERVRKFGGSVHKLSDTVFHFASSGVYRINRKKYLIVNLGTNKKYYDEKYHKTIAKHYKHLLASLDKNGNKVDRVISILPPHKIAADFSGKWQNNLYNLYMDEIFRRCEFDDWYFSEFDLDTDAERFHSVYRSFIELDGKIFTEYSGDELDFEDYL